MRKILPFALIIFSISTGIGICWEEKVIHPKLTDLAVDLLIEKKLLPLCGNRIKSYIDSGSTEEDNTPLYFFHFYPSLDSGDDLFWEYQPHPYSDTLEFPFNVECTCDAIQWADLNERQFCEARIRSFATGELVPWPNVRIRNYFTYPIAEKMLALMMDGARLDI